MMKKRHLLISLFGGLLAAEASVSCSSSSSPPENLGHVSQAIIPSTVLSVPVRWCVIGNDANGDGVHDPGEQGVPAFTNPEFAAPKEANTDILLWRRHERVSENVYIPGANVTLRSALTQPAALGGNILHFPVIPDPDVSVGQYGDELVFERKSCQRLPIFPTDTDAINASNAERDKLLTACAGAWKTILDAGESVNDLGIIALNIRRFVNQCGQESTDVAGIGNYRQPPGNFPYVRIIDNAFTLGGTPLSLGGSDDQFEQALAHEVGHSLPGTRPGDGRSGLLHTGISCLMSDPTGANATDVLCTNGQAVTATKNLMNPFPLLENVDSDSLNEQTNLALSQSIPDQFSETPVNGNICGGGNACPTIVDQVSHVRDAATFLGGCTFAGTTNPCSTVSSIRTDARDDVDVPAVDLTILVAREPSESGETIYAHRVAGSIPASLGRFDVFKYLVFADLDNDPTTGGMPSSLGFSTAFRGAELVSLVRVTPIIIDNAVAGMTTDATVWTFSSGAFVQASDSGITSEVGQETDISDSFSGLSSTTIALASTAAIHIPNSIRGPRSASYRVQAMTIRESSGSVVATDVLDESPEETGEVIHTAFPTFPICSLSPNPVAALAKLPRRRQGCCRTRTSRCC